MVNNKERPKFRGALRPLGDAPPFQKGVRAMDTEQWSGTSTQCSLCLDEVNDFVHLPCCNGRSSRTPSSNGAKIQVCNSCILAMSTPNCENTVRICRCPSCLEWLSVGSSALTDGNTSDGVKIKLPQETSRCRICCQEKKKIVDSSNDNICDACFMGLSSPLVYECKQCHRQQKIHHPMYRYQEASDSFGTKSWACHSGCQTFTKWRIVPSYAGMIPVGDIPSMWGKPYVDLARAKVIEVRQEAKAVGEESSNGTTDEDTSEGDYDFIECRGHFQGPAIMKWDANDNKENMSDMGSFQDHLAGSELKEIIMEGWVYKLGSGHDWLASTQWKPRWACLALTKVPGIPLDVPVFHLYWHDTFSSAPSTSISLDSTIVVAGEKNRAVETICYNFSIVSNRSGTHPQTNDGNENVKRTFAAPIAERKKWVHAMNTAIKDYEMKKRKMSPLKGIRRSHNR